MDGVEVTWVGPSGAWWFAKGLLSYIYKLEYYTVYIHYTFIYIAELLARLLNLSSQGNAKLQRTSSTWNIIKIVGHGEPAITHLGLSRVYRNHWKLSMTSSTLTFIIIIVVIYFSLKSKIMLIYFFRIFYSVVNFFFIINFYHLCLILNCISIVLIRVEV